jgi:hypothetical protein
MTGRLLALAFCLVAPLAAAAAPLGRPTGLSVVNGPVPRISWNPVPGAALYRLAIFESGGAAGQGPLAAAVWVQGTAWTYGVDPVLPKIGGLPSTSPKALSVGRSMHVMVRAGDASGGRLGQWASVNFTFKPAPPASATPSPLSVSSATATPTPAAQSRDGDAELEIQGGPEFKSTDAAGQDLTSAAVAATAPAQDGAAPAATPTASAAGAADLLKAGRYEDAEAAYKALLKDDASNADLWEALGDVYKAQSMKVEAADCYEKALKFGSKHQNLQDWLDQNVRH